MDAALKILAESEMLSALSAQAREGIASKMRRVEAKRGSIIFSHLDEGDAVYMVLDGRVKVHLHDADGRELILADMGAGAIFGEMSLLDDHPRSATVTAAKDCHLAVLSRDGLMAVIGEHPEVAMVLLQLLSRRLRVADQVIFDLALRDVVDRLARLLMAMAVPHPDEPEWLVIEATPSQSEIASRVGASRETISRTIAHFRRLGLVVSSGRRTSLTGAFVNRFDHLLGGFALL